MKEKRNMSRDLNYSFGFCVMYLEFRLCYVSWFRSMPLRHIRDRDIQRDRKMERKETDEVKEKSYFEE